VAEEVIATNKAAQRNYTILESFEAGIQLRGGEVKSLRAHRANLKDSFGRIEKGEVYLYNLHISPYEYNTDSLEDPRRPRKLLLHKSEVKKLIGQTSQKGLTLIPLKLYFKRGFAKVELALAKGKKLYDKRREIKRREAEREVRRELRKK
jgi:SsrA-binding protein